MSESKINKEEREIIREREYADAMWQEGSRGEGAYMIKMSFGLKDFSLDVMEGVDEEEALTRFWEEVEERREEGAVWAELVEMEWHGPEGMYFENGSVVAREELGA